MSTFKHLSHLCSKKSQVILSTYWKKECSQNAKKLLASVLFSQGILLCNCLPERPVFYLLVFDALRATSTVLLQPVIKSNTMLAMQHIILLQVHKDFFQRETSLVDVSARVSSDSDFLHWNRVVLAINYNPLNIATIF